MTKGEKISYAILKEVTRYSFEEWLETWRIDIDDFNTFINAGKSAVNKEEQNNAD